MAQKPYRKYSHTIAVYTTVYPYPLDNIVKQWTLWILKSIDLCPSLYVFKRKIV